MSYTLSLDTVSNWKQAHGESVVGLKDGKLVVTTAEGNESSYNPQYALIYDENSPAIETGEITATLTHNYAGRFCLVFRYQDKDNYSSVGYDLGGTWVVKDVVAGRETTENFAPGVNAENGDELNLKATFIDKNISLSINGKEVFNKEVLAAPRSGKMGIRTWGYAGNYASVTVSSMTYNELRPPEKDENGNYMTSFTDEYKRGGWSMVWNAQGAELPPVFTDGAGDAGYMTVQAGPLTSDNGNTFYKDSLSPAIGNGFLEFDVTNQSGGRLGFLFRVRDNAGMEPIYSGLMYDADGSWKYHVNDGANGKDYPVSGIPALNKDTKYHIRIEYVSANVRMLVDGTEVLNQNFAGSDIGEGQIGLRVWGWNSGNPDDFGKMKIDNVINGYFNAVLLNPREKFVPAAEAGTYDIPVELSQTGNAFTGIRAGETALVEGTDYSVNDDKDVITIKKEYVAKVKNTPETVLTFVFADGYMADFALRIMGQEAEVFYERDFSDGMAGFEKTAGQASAELNAEKKTLSIRDGQGAIFIDQNSPALHNSEVEFKFDPANDRGNLALVLRYQDADNWVAVGIDGVGGNHTPWYVYTPGGKQPLFGADESQTKGDGDGQRIYSNRAEPYTMKARLVENTVTVWLDGAEILQSTVSGISGGTGKAGVYYRGGAGADIYGLNVRTANPLSAETSEKTERTISSDVMSVLVDNDFPRIIRYTFDGKTIEAQEKPYYVLEVNNITVDKDGLTITSNIGGDTASYRVLTEQGHSFDVEFKVVGNVLEMRLKNISESIRTINFPNMSLISMPSTETGAMLVENNYEQQGVHDLGQRRDGSNHSYTSLAVLSSDQIAAAINCGSIKSRSEICYQTSINGDHYTTGLWPNEFLVRGLDNDVIEGGTWAKVAVTRDRNGDGKVDYQDGAIALRDDIPTKRYTKGDIFNAYTSIAVNEASWAQHPFLKTLDLVKKMSLGLDGFPQNVVYKGYQSQGHDAGHPNFADINEQAGGAEDFRTLIEEAPKYGATIGVHINETETYPEAPQYGALASNNPGWPWFDNANQMVRENDILTAYADKIPGGNMDKRLDDLKAITKTNTSNLGIVYVDTYFDTRWPAYRLAQKLNDNGWALATEYTNEFTKDSVWGHHIGGGYNGAGNLVRFVNNGTQDIFGYSNLFRGPRDRHSTGIFGWQADQMYGQNYAKTIEDFFVRILPNKYLANYPIVIWESDNQATLGQNKEVVTKYENNKNSIYKDGNLIADGNNIFIPWDPVTEEKIYHWNESGGETTWTLPESWKNETTVKLFKLSDRGRTDMVTLNVANRTITVNAAAKTGYVVYPGSSDAAETVLTDYDWSEGTPLKDTGFNSYSWDYGWTKSSTSGSTDHITFSTDNATVIGQGDTNVLIKGRGDGKLTQTMKGLTPGQTYSASVFADVTDGRRATLSVNTADGVTVSNYTEHYYGVYGSSHSNKKGSRYQRIKVQFTVPEGEAAAEITLEAAAGKDDASYVRFDDVRVYEIDKTGRPDYYYYEDFENFDVGFGPFENGVSGQNHMSETSAFNEDTISGRYSLKIQNYDMHTSARTTPVTLRLPKNTECVVSFEYLLSNGGGYTISAMEDGQALNSKALEPTGMGGTNKKTALLEFITGDTGEAYLDLTRTGGTVILDNLSVQIKKDTEKPTAPGNVKAENVTKESAKITWTASQDNVGVKEYEVYLGTEKKGVAAGTQYSLAGLTADTEYTVKVVAVDGAGNKSDASSVTFTTEKESQEPPADTEKPTAPGNVKAENVTKESAKITWTASQDNIGVKEYEVYLGTEKKGVTADTEYELTGLSADTEYTVKVVAVDEAGNKSDASSVTFTTEKESQEPPADTEKPTAPGNVKAENVTKESAKITWTASQDNIGVKEYRVYLGTELKATVTGTSCKLTGLSPNTVYTVKVAAADEAGNISDKASVQFTTDKEPENPPTDNEPEDAVKIVEGILKDLEKLAGKTDDEIRKGVEAAISVIEKIDFDSMEVIPADLMDLLVKTAERMMELLGFIPDVRLGAGTPDIEFGNVIFNTGFSENSYIQVNKDENWKASAGVHLKNCLALQFLLIRNGQSTSVKVPMPVSIELPENLKNSDGLLLLHFADGSDKGEEIPFTVKDGWLHFIARSFSIYVVGEKADEEDNGGSDGGSSQDSGNESDASAPNADPGKKSPKTFDNSIFTPSAEDAAAQSAAGVRGQGSNGIHTAMLAVLTVLLIAAAIAAVMAYRRKSK